MANNELSPLPETARDMAYNIAQLVNTLVGRAIHVAIVNGLNRNLLRNENQP